MKTKFFRFVVMVLASYGACGSGHGQIIKTEIDFSTYPTLPFHLSGGVTRQYVNIANGTFPVVFYPATISTSGIRAELQFPPPPLLPESNPELSLSGTFFGANVIGFQLVLGDIAFYSTPPTLFTHSGSPWSSAALTPLLDSSFPNRLANEGSYIDSFSVYETGASFQISAIKIYSVGPLTVPDTPIPMYVLTFLLAAICAFRAAWRCGERSVSR